MTITPVQLARLPLYAQEHIKLLEQRAAEALQAAKDAAGEISLDHTDTAIVRYIEPGDIALPNNARVRFHHRAKEPRVFHHWIDVRTDEDGIEVMGVDVLSIEMQSSNVFRVKVVDQLERHQRLNRKAVESRGA